MKEKKPLVVAVVPRWISFFLLIFGIVFFTIFIKMSIKSGNTSFVIMGILFAVLFLGITIYQLIKGVAPGGFRFR